MGDKVTELQNSLDVLSQIFYTSVGVIQRDATPKFDARSTAKETALFVAQLREMATHVVGTAAAIDSLIENLPGIASCEAEQLVEMASLQECGYKAGQLL